MDASALPKRVSKACDACKLRKVKCNGQERCQQCSHLGLRCIYSVSAKPRSQGRRGRVITEYKNKTANGIATSPPILPASPSNPVFQPPLGPIAYLEHHNGCESSSLLSLVLLER